MVSYAAPKKYHLTGLLFRAGGTESPVRVAQTPTLKMGVLPYRNVGLSEVPKGSGTSETFHTPHRSVAPSLVYDGYSRAQRASAA